MENGNPGLDADQLAQLNQLSYAEQGDMVGMEATMLRNSGVTCGCDFHRPLKTNWCVFSCRHCKEEQQDPVNPCGLVALPEHYYLCMECWNLRMKNRFKWGTEMVAQCWGCIMEFADKLKRENPDLLLDLTKGRS